jgi:hypothetical protein
MMEDKKGTGIERVFVDLLKQFFNYPEISFPMSPIPSTETKAMIN